MAFFNVLNDTSICSYAFLVVGEQSDSIGSLIPLEKQGTRTGEGRGAERSEVLNLYYLIKTL